jgi:chlorite dismutase
MEQKDKRASDNDRRQYVNFAFYKVDPLWRRLPSEERKKGKCELVEVVRSYEQDVLVTPYSLVGIRGDCDFMLWRIGYDPLKLQEMSAQLLATELGKYLATPYSYLSITKRSIYVDKHTHEGQEGTRLKFVPGQFRYLFIYPFVKSKAWYRLTKHARQGMMDEHIEIGHKYPTVRLNTTYSFGLDTPTFTCIHRELPEVLDLLGG